MKKYFVAILFVAAIAVVGGLKFNNIQIAHAEVACNPDTFSAHCEGSTYINCGYAGSGPSSNGTTITTENSALCGAITVGNNGGPTPPPNLTVCQYASDCPSNQFCNVNTGTCQGLAAGASVSTGLTPDLNWSPVSGASYYNVVVSTDKNFATTVINTRVTGSNTYRVMPAGNATHTPVGTEGSLIAGKTYYWTAQACNAYGCGPKSAIWSFSVSSNAVVGSKPAVIGGSGRVTQDVYSLISSFATWTRADGTKVSPQRVAPVQIWIDTSNGMQVFPNASSAGIISLLNAVVSTKTVGNGNGGAGIPVDPCGASNLLSVVGDFKCCKNGAASGGGYGWTSSGTSDATCGADITVGHIYNQVQ